MRTLLLFVALPAAAAVGALYITSCGYGGCIAEGAMVETPHGPVSIESLAAGDLIYSVSLASGELVPARVAKVWSAWRWCRELRMDAGSLRLTASHPVFDPKSGGYFEAGAFDADARRSAMVYSSGAFHIEPAQLAGAVATPCRVFDISVDSPQENFIAEGVVVHNKSVPRDVECATDDDCPSSRPACNDVGSCVECIADEDCSNNQPYCVGGSCVICKSHGELAELCPEEEPYCADGQCAECIFDRDCPEDRPLCSSSQCVSD